MRYLAFLAALPLMAAVQGTVTNQTTGQPQAGAVVSLMNLGAGMSPVGAARTDAGPGTTSLWMVIAGSPRPPAGASQWLS